MKACVDVHYRGGTAIAGCALFQAWEDREPLRLVRRRCRVEAPYIPGQLHRRELPCLLRVLAAVGQVPAVIVVDGYVWLSARHRPGLGARLHAALGRRSAVIGVAKGPWAGDAPCTPLLRGRSRRPLYISSVGIPLRDAVRAIASMHGPHRIPSLLRTADRAARELAPPASG